MAGLRRWAMLGGLTGSVCALGLVIARFVGVTSVSDTIGLVSAALGAASFAVSLVPAAESASAARLPQLAAPEAGSETPNAQGISLSVPVPGSQLVGQQHLVAQLLAIAGRSDGRVHVLSGMGGMGKTSIAAEVARQAARKSVRVWWIAATDRAAVRHGLLSLAEQTGVDPARIERARSGRVSGADLVWRHLATLRRPWLLVLDNVDDATVFSESTVGDHAGRGWLREPGGGTLLLTSRLVEPNAWGLPVHSHPVSPLSPEQGAQALIRLAPAAGTLREATDLAVRLGCVPLALHVAGNYLASPGARIDSFAAYREGLDDRFMAIQRRSSAPHPNARTSVIMTWEMSLDQLESEGCPQARPLLRLMSCFAGATPIPVSLFDEETVTRHLPGIRVPEDVDTGVRGLLRVGLVQSDRGDQESDRPATFLVHPLVAETSRAHLHDSADARSTQVAALALLEAATEGLDPRLPSDWPPLSRLRPHVLAVLTQLPGDLLPAGIAAANRVAWGLACAGSLPTAEDVLRSVLRPAEQLARPHLEVVRATYTLGHTLRAQGRFHEAQETLRRALEWAAAAQLPSADRAPVTHDRGIFVLRPRSRLLELERRFAPVPFDEPGADDGPGSPPDPPAQVRPGPPETALATEVRFELAAVLFALGDFAGAESAYEAVRMTCRASYGEDHEFTIAAQHELATVLRARGALDRAETEFRAVSDICARGYGANHPFTLTARHNHAGVLQVLGRLSRAEAELAEVLRAATRTSGDEHPSTLAHRHELAGLWFELGEAHRAEQELGRVVAARRRLLGANHPSTLASRHNLSAVCAARGRWTVAAADLPLIMTSLMELVGERHPDVLAARNTLGLLQLASGSCDEALAGFRALSADRAAILGPEHPSTLTTRHNLAAALLDAGDRARAAAEFRAVCNARSRVFGPLHPATANSRAALELLGDSADRATPPV
ncbi:tetratricopeptide repeat protein [Streptomyces sp. NPDC057690]|uniref:tetratricopeptide repeat protein n=1 Tax=Streptomyces sp. NPDC057690 TaxID=3346214 RepID=UPI00368C7777